MIYIRLLCSKSTLAIVYSKMATLSSRRILLLRKIQKTAFASVAQRSMGDVKPWNYLWKPGPYPETEEGTYDLLLRLRLISITQITSFDYNLIKFK